MSLETFKNLLCNTYMFILPNMMTSNDVLIDRIQNTAYLFNELCFTKKSFQKNLIMIHDTGYFVKNSKCIISSTIR